MKFRVRPEIESYCCDNRAETKTDEKTERKDNVPATLSPSEIDADRDQERRQNPEIERNTKICEIRARSSSQPVAVNCGPPLLRKPARSKSRSRGRSPITIFVSDAFVTKKGQRPNGKTED